MAMGIYEAYRMIAGENVEVQYICLSDGKDIEEFKVELAAMKDWIDQCEELFVLSDIMGGSPYITTIQYLQDNDFIQKSTIIAGMNLPLLLSIGLGSELNDKSKILDVIDESRNSIQLFEYCDECEDDEL